MIFIKTCDILFCGDDMEDKLFELLEKMYVDLKNDINSVKRDLRTEIQAVSNLVTKLDLTIENELKLDIKALLDGYKQLAEGQEEIKDQISDLQTKFQGHDVQISALKAVK
jgi:predicted  nucleic acid-binding Zn-ribbon protein